MNRSSASVTLLALALALGVGAPAWAQSKKELAAKVVQLQMVDIENVARIIATQSMQPIVQGASKAMANVPTDKREALAKDIQAELRKTGGEIEPLLVDRIKKLAPGVLTPVLEEKFTDEELRQIVTWLESSASRKLRQAGNEMQSILAQKLVAESKPAIEPKLKALDEKIRNLFGGGAGKN